MSEHVCQCKNTGSYAKRLEEDLCKTERICREERRLRIEAEKRPIRTFLKNILRGDA